MLSKSSDLNVIHCQFKERTATISDAKFRTVERGHNNYQSREQPSAHVRRIRVSPETIVCPLSVKVEIRLG